MNNANTMNYKKTTLLALLLVVLQCVSLAIVVSVKIFSIHVSIHLLDVVLSFISGLAVIWIFYGYQKIDIIKLLPIKDSLKWIIVFLPIVFIFMWWRHSFGPLKISFDLLNYDAIIVILIYAVLEEVIFRGYVLGNFLKKWPLYIAIITNSTLDIMTRIIPNGGDVSSLVFIFLFFIILSYSYIKGGLYTSIFIHIVEPLAKVSLK